MNAQQSTPIHCLQARVGELEDSLQLSRDDGSAQVTALELRCREQDRLLERQREELELQVHMAVTRTGVSVSAGPRGGSVLAVTGTAQQSCSTG